MEVSNLKLEEHFFLIANNCNLILRKGNTMECSWPFHSANVDCFLHLLDEESLQLQEDSLG